MAAIDASMSSRRQPKPSELSLHPTAQQQKLSGKHERCSEQHSESERGGNKHDGSKKSKLSSVKSTRFPCPFALRDPAKYGRENGCSNYSRPIETVIRVRGAHHQIESFSDDTCSTTFLASTGRSTATPVMEKTTSSGRSSSSWESRDRRSRRRRKNYGNQCTRRSSRSIPLKKTPFQSLVRRNTSLMSRFHWADKQQLSKQMLEP
jgi:hypothetical protein